MAWSPQKVPHISQHPKTANTISLLPKRVRQNPIIMAGAYRPGCYSSNVCGVVLTYTMWDSAPYKQLVWSIHSYPNHISNTNKTFSSCIQKWWCSLFAATLWHIYQVTAGMGVVCLQTALIPIPVCSVLKSFPSWTWRRVSFPCVWDSVFLFCGNYVEHSDVQKTFTIPPARNFADWTRRAENFWSL